MILPRWLRAGLSGTAVTLIALGPMSAHAVDFKSIGAEPAVFYDAPSLRGLKVFVAPRGMPVEMVVSQGDWVRVRDAQGDLSWVERKALSDKRTVVASRLTTVHAAADDAAPVVVRAQAGVLLELLEPPVNGWLHVRHRDGASGWVHLNEVWGA